MSLEGLKFVMEEDPMPRTKIRVVGVGGGGSNAVARMLDEGLAGIDFCILNTDAQALAVSQVPTKFAIGSKVTNGLGAGSDPAVGRQAALEDTERIIDLLEGADMVFVTVGLGGGTGTGAAPVVASLAKELGALTVAVVTKPFTFEGPKRRKQAEQGMAELAGVVDTIITIPNDQLLSLVPKGTSFFDAFRVADDVLRQAVQGISDIITTPGLVNRDFSDIRSIMSGMGYAMMGTASARGENACTSAAEKAISSPLLEAGGVRGARGILINISGSSRLGLHEVNEACTLVREAAANEDVQINFGVVLNEALGEEVKVTVIATGFVRENLPRIERKALRADAVAAPSGRVSPNIVSAIDATDASNSMDAMDDEEDLDASEELPSLSPLTSPFAAATMREPLRPPVVVEAKERPEPVIATPSAREAVKADSATASNASTASMAAAASGNGTPRDHNNGGSSPVREEPAARENPMDDLEVPAILRRDRRMVQ